MLPSHVKSAILLTILTLLLSILFLHASSATSFFQRAPSSFTSLPPASYTPHSPIRICGDEDLRKQAAWEGWLGRGTRDNPIVISGYAIGVGDSNESVAIYIEDTSLYLRIENCYLYSKNASAPYRGIRLIDATHVMIVNCTVAHMDIGIQLMDCVDCTLYACKVLSCRAGFDISPKFLISTYSSYLPPHQNPNTTWLSHDVRELGANGCFNCSLYSCSAESCKAYGFQLVYASHCTLTSCTVYDCDDCGFFIWDSEECLITNCTAQNCFTGFCLYSLTLPCSNCTLVSCNASYNTGYGFLLSRCTQCSLKYCQGEYNGWNYAVWGSTLTHYTSNLFVGCLSGGKPVFCYANQNIGHLILNAGALFIVNCTCSSPLEDIQLPPGGIFLLAFLNDVFATNCSCSGVLIQHSMNITIQETTASDGLSGFWLFNCTNCTLLECDSYDHAMLGFGISFCSQCMLQNCYASHSREYGFLIEASSFCALNACTTSTAKYGFWLKYSSFCTLTRCTAFGGTYGFYLYQSRCCTLALCEGEYSRCCYFIEGEQLADYASHNITQCRAEERPVEFLVNQTLTSFTSHLYGSLFIINCTLPSSISQIEISPGGICELAFISSTTVANVSGGLVLHHATNVTITRVFASSVFGILLYECKYCTLTNSSANNCHHGISLTQCRLCTLRFCYSCYNAKNGFTLEKCDNCTLVRCKSIQNQDFGLYVTGSSFCLIYDNFFQNEQNAYLYGCRGLSFNVTKYTPGPNILNGPYLGGNYWSDYRGSDTNYDGYGDVPYRIGNFYDYLPLVTLPESLPPLRVKILYPENNTCTSNRTITLRWETNLSLLHRVEIVVVGDNQPPHTYTVGACTFYTLSNLSEDFYTVTVRVYGYENQTGNATVCFTIDYTPPHLYLLEPSNHTLTTHSAVTLRWNASDFSGVTCYQVYIEDVRVLTTSTPRATLELLPGLNRITIRAFDRAGNVAQITLYVSVFPLRRIVFSTFFILLALAFAVSPYRIALLPKTYERPPRPTPSKPLSVWHVVRRNA